MNILKHITILSQDGISLYHRAYSMTEMDDVLFSALSGAIIAFTKELGDELYAIKMKRQTIIYKQYKQYIVIFSINSEYPEDEAELKIKQFMISPPLIKFFQTGIPQQLNEELDKIIMEIFNASTDISENTPIDELTGEVFLRALKQLDEL